MATALPAPKRHFALRLEYDGTDYHGWQRQPGVMTVQEMIESKLAVITGQTVSVLASGRTDAGVHARGQVVSFRVHTRLEAAELKRALNSLLPPDIVVLRAAESQRSFHARFSAVSKLYHYQVLNRREPSALLRRTCWHIKQPLDLEPMREALRLVLGEHDFAAFMGGGSSVRSTVRTLLDAGIEKQSPALLIFSFEANGFLRHMVRNLVGTIVDVGRGKYEPDRLAAVLASRDRRRAGMTAPARGLFLVRVDYGSMSPF